MKIELFKPSILSGWHIGKQEYETAHKSNKLVKLVTELSNVCNLSCEGCFTKKIKGSWTNKTKKRLPDEMSYETSIAMVDEACALGAISLDIVGAGEPTLDSTFKEYIEYALDKGLYVNVFTHGANPALKELAENWQEKNVSFFIKLWSLDQRLQDKYVSGAIENYSMQRDKALEFLISLGYAAGRDVTVDGIDYKLTRIGADVLVMKSNYSEIPDIFRFCRNNNIMPEIKTYIPEGPTRLDHEHSRLIYTDSHLEKLRKEEINPEEFDKLRKDLIKIDQEFGIREMPTLYPQSCKCTQSMASLYVTIQGDIRSCVGTHLSYGKYILGENMLQKVLQKRIEKVGFGCVPRLEDAAERHLQINDDMKAIYSQE